MVALKQLSTNCDFEAVRKIMELYYEKSCKNEGSCDGGGFLLSFGSHNTVEQAKLFLTL